MPKLIAWLLVGTVTITQGCGTMIAGTSQIVPINSEPPGAKVSINGYNQTTPAVVTLSRSKEHFVAFTKEGCEKSQVLITRELQVGRSILGNILFLIFFPVALIVDVSTGGAYDLTPENVHVTLDCKTKTP
jgi:hypothetical protein